MTRVNISRKMTENLKQCHHLTNSQTSESFGWKASKINHVLKKVCFFSKF